MSNFWKKIFWILFFLLLIFCYKFFILSNSVKKPLTQTAGKIQTALILDSQTAENFSKTKSVVPLPILPSVESKSIFLVDRVIDGDTIVISEEGHNETVRLLGIDTPETVDPRKPVQCFGEEASAETKSLLDGREVTLQSDPTQSDRDKYGRLLRYVFRADGLFVDEYLVKQGFAREYTYFGVPYKYQTAFRADQSAAQLAGLGLWATSTCDGKR
jgi:micrococcal nuclease